MKSCRWWVGLAGIAIPKVKACRSFLGRPVSRQDLDEASAKVKPFTLLPITSRLSCCLKLTSFTVLNFDGAKTTITGGRLNMGITMEILNVPARRFDDAAQRSTSNECVRLIRKLRWIGMDDEAERVLAQLSGWPFRPTETVIAGPWATD